MLQKFNVILTIKWTAKDRTAKMNKSNNEVPQSELFPDECRPLSMCWEINRVNLSRGCRNLCQFCQVCDLSSVIINKIHNPLTLTSPEFSEHQVSGCETKIYWAAPRREMNNFKLVENTMVEIWISVRWKHPPLPPTLWNPLTHG